MTNMAELDADGPALNAPAWNGVESDLENEDDESENDDDDDAEPVQESRFFKDDSAPWSQSNAQVQQPMKLKRMNELKIKRCKRADTSTPRVKDSKGDNTSRSSKGDGTSRSSKGDVTNRSSRNGVGRLGARAGGRLTHARLLSPPRSAPARGRREKSDIDLLAPPSQSKLAFAKLSEMYAPGLELKTALAHSPVANLNEAAQYEALHEALLGRRPSPGGSTSSGNHSHRSKRAGRSGAASGGDTNRSHTTKRRGTGGESGGNDTNRSRGSSKQRARAANASSRESLNENLLRALSSPFARGGDGSCSERRMDELLLQEADLLAPPARANKELSGGSMRKKPACSATASHGGGELGSSGSPTIMRELLARQNATVARSALSSTTGAPPGRGGAEAMMQRRREEAEAAVKRTQSLAATMVKNQMADMQAARGRPPAGGRSSQGAGTSVTASHSQVNKRGLGKSNSSPSRVGRAARPLSGLGASTTSPSKRSNLIPKQGALFEKRELDQPLSFSFENYHEQFALTRGLGSTAVQIAAGIAAPTRESMAPSGGGAEVDTGDGGGGGSGGGRGSLLNASLRGPSPVMKQVEEPIALETGWRFQRVKEE